MSQDRHPMQVPPDNTGAILAWLQDVVRQARLAWRLFRDQRVPLWTKLIPPVAVAYALFPVDIIPDVALGLGQLDDIAVLLLGIKFFIELSPPEVVREHLAALGAHIKEWHLVDEEERPSAVIEATYEIKELAEQETPTEAKEAGLIEAQEGDN
jgi:uncharacterized membrane protein YkvA (DUF1232 family)